MATQRMQTSPFVCCSPCLIMEDDFNRVNNTDLCSIWVEASGNWEIASGALKANTTGLVYTKAQIDKYRRNVIVTAKNVQAGKVYRLAAAVAEDGSDYLYVELACGSGGQIHIRLGTLNGGVLDDYECGIELGQDYHLFACLSDTGAYGGLAEVSAPVWDCITFDGPRAGIANAGTAAEFDDFGFFRHALDDESGDLRCHACMCDCEGQCLPRTLKLTLESSCPHRDGLEATLTLDEGAYPSFQWYGEATWPDVVGGTSTLHKFRFFCTAPVGCDDEDQRFFLCAGGFHSYCSGPDWPQDHGSVCGDAGPASRCSDSYTCPLNVRFGPGGCDISETEINCIETIVVTT